MRILTLSYRKWPLAPRPQQRFLPMGVKLAAKGHDVTIIYLGANEVSKVTLAEFKGVHIVAIPNPRGRLFADARRTVYKLAFCLHWLLRDNDIVQLEDGFHPDIGLLGLVAHIVKGVPIVVDWEDLIMGLLIHQRVLQRVVPLFASRLVVVSEVLMRWSYTLGVRPDRIAKIPMGSDLDRISSHEKAAARNRIGVDSSRQVLGAIAPPPGTTQEPLTTLLTDALARVVKVFPDVLLLFIGNTHESSRILTLESARKQGVADRIQFTGRVTDDELSYWYSSCDVLLMPMLDTLLEKGRYPGKFGDFLAAGRPIVATDIGDTAKLISQYQCGLTCLPDSPEDFAEKIVSILSSQEAMKRMGAEARLHAEGDHSWKSRAEALERTYLTIAR